MLSPNAEANRADNFHRLCLASNDLYPDLVAQLTDETGITIDHQKCGTLEAAFDEDHAIRIAAKLEIQNKLGINAIALDAGEIISLIPDISSNVIRGIYYPDDGYVDNRLMLKAFIQYAHDHGIRIIENFAIKTLLIEKEQVTGVSDGGRTFTADVTILATGAWTSLIKFGEHPAPFDIRPIKGQMLSFSTLRRPLEKVVIGPDVYLTPRGDGRVLVGATVEDVGFDKTLRDAAISRLADNARRILPLLSDVEVNDSWCGLRPFAADGLPIIGEVPGSASLYVATAHYRNGVLLAPMTAKVICEHIVNGRASVFLDAFGPERILRNAKATNL
ncbi:glycine oxidase ThiO [Leptolyngbya sp. 7M]|uniref:glycine oxidase ThiO n=1 Tax=Leptolyngbya sp. 7M TaxID=2812896 RepID=UPI001B8B3CEC|nr:glycine oxidase ThiO [Leptolyngbya sp. 7M]QYO67214.1 glycine oxidase ThiO [Leptolyngbya sp. 7M]